MFFDPPILPEDNSFIGIPVYVDFDAIIYVQELRGGNWICNGFMWKNNNRIFRYIAFQFIFKLIFAHFKEESIVFSNVGFQVVWYMYDIVAIFSEPLAWQLPNNDFFWFSGQMS